jgi:hypothetical protein
MEELLGEIVTGVEVVLAAAAWRKIESGWLKSMLRAVIEGVESATEGLPEAERQAVKAEIKKAATRTKAQDRLHAMVKKLTEESNA